MAHGKSALEYLTWGGVLHKLSCNISRSDHGVFCARSFFFLRTDLLKCFKTRRWKNCKQFQKWVDWTPMWTLKLSFRRFFLTALLGFITIQNYIGNIRDRSLSIAGGGMDVTFPPSPPPPHHIFIFQANLSSPLSESFQSFQWFPLLGSQLRLMPLFFSPKPSDTP